MPNYGHFTDSQIETINDMALNRTSCKVDKITHFTLRPPKSLLIDKVGLHHRWFDISSKPLKDSIAIELLDIDFYKTAWIDGKQCQILLRRKALPEIILWIEKIQNENEHNVILIFLLEKLQYLFDSFSEGDPLEDVDINMLRFAQQHLMYDYDDGFDKHLPIPVYSYIKPTMGPQFLLHILLSMGRFETERKLLLNPSMKECLRYAKLIGTEDDELSLSSYSNNLLAKFIKCQMRYYPNGERTIDSWIIVAGDLFDSVIIANEIPMTQMPTVQLSALLLVKETAFENFKTQLKTDITQAALREMGEATIDCCNIPSLDDLVNASIDSPSNWDAIENFRKSENQSEESFEEQRFAVQICVQSIDSYLNVMTNKCVKNVIIAGFPGGRKTFCMMCVILYAMSRGLTVISTAMMAHRAIKLGGIHWHKLLSIPVDRTNNMSVARMTEVAIERLEKHPEKLHSLEVLMFLLVMRLDKGLLNLMM